MGTLEGRTVVVVGAVSDAGRFLCACLCDAGARIVALDRDHDALWALARRAPDRIEPLAMDIMNPRRCVDFGRIWDKEPVHLLINLHPLRHPALGGRMITAVAGMCEALREGLLSGNGVVHTVWQEASQEDVHGQSVNQGLETLSRGLAGQFDIPTNGIVMGRTAKQRDLWHITQFLSSSEGRAISGAILPLR